jgi:hypothetical protein
MKETYLDQFKDVSEQKEIQISVIDLRWNSEDVVTFAGV